MEVLRGLADDVRGLDLHIGGEEILQRLLGHGSRHRLIAQRSHSGHSGQSAFKLSNVLRKALGDQIKHVVRDIAVVHGRHHAKNGDTGFQIRRLDIHRQPGVEARDEAGLEALEVFRSHVGRDDDTLIRLM